MKLRILYYNGEGETLFGVKRVKFNGEDGDLTIFYENDIHEERHRVFIITVEEG
jgi:hypothetical protein